jgi:hypothetical protein
MQMKNGWPQGPIQEERKMKKFSLALLAIATALAISPVASAQTYDFTFTGANSGPDANAVGTGTLEVGAGDVVTSITGTFDGYAITGLVSYAGNDNVFVPSGSPSYFDFQGLSFAANSIDYNLFYDGSTGTYILDSGSNPGGYPTPSTPITFSATEVPEGGASLLYLLLAGAGCFGAKFFSSRNRLGSRASA